jgi:hypothetical protein
MRHLLTFLAAAFLHALVLAQAPGDDVARYRLKTTHPSIGSLFHDTLATANRYPIDRPYSKFTAQEKAALNAEYENMPASDEPPFPEAGLEPIIRRISKLTGALHLEGAVTIYVTVDAKGNATQVSLVKYPDVETAKAIAYVLVKTKYKPAVCSGQPCRMDWAFRTRLGRPQ